MSQINAKKVPGTHFYAVKKAIAVIAFLLAATGAFGQTDSKLLDTKKYFSYFPINKGEDVSDNHYVWSSDDENYERFMVLGGNNGAIDTPIEFALLSYYSPPIIKIRPAQADAILPANNPKLADQKLGAAVFQEMQVLRFLGDTAAVTRHEAILTFITDRKNATRQEIEAFYRQNIAAYIALIVDEEFKKTRGGYVPYDVYVNNGHKEIIDGIKDIAIVPSRITEHF